MFLRHWSGLPEDPKFPCDLEKLGYTPPRVRDAIFETDILP